MEKNSRILWDENRKTKSAPSLPQHGKRVPAVNILIIIEYGPLKQAPETGANV